MAVIDGNLPIQSGSANDWTFYKRNGKTIGRQKHQSHHPSSERTIERMKTRTKWTNLLNVWRDLGPLLKGLFETKRVGMTDYNAFMGVNMPLATVYAPKTDWNEHVCVIEDYVVSQGTLVPSIVLEDNDDVWQSNIRVGDLNLTEDTRMGELAYRVLENNAGVFRQGDEIQLIAVWQEFFSLSTMSAILELDTSVQRTFRGTGWLDFLTVNDGYLSVRPQQEMLVALVQRREEREEGGRKRLRVSSQRLVGWSSLTHSYSGELGLEKALRSYDNYKPENYSAPSPNTGAYEQHTNQVSNGASPQKEKKITEVEINAMAVPQGAGRIIDESTGKTFFSEFVVQHSTVALRAVPAKGYSFLCWDTGELNPRLRLQAKEQMSLKAIFTPEG